MNRFRWLAALLLLQYPLTVAAANQLTMLNGVADFPDYRVDTGGNLHLVWHDAISGSLYYQLRDPSGNDMIPAVQLATGTWPSLAVINGLVYIAWQNTSDGEVWFTRLNPSLAPLDGTAVIASDIREVEVPLSGAGGFNALHPRMRGEVGGDLHVVWESDNGGMVEYVKIDTDGNLLNGLTGPLAIGGAATGAGLPDIDVDNNGHAQIVFSNNAATMANEVYHAMVDGATSAILIDATLLSLDDGLLAGNATVNVDTFDNTLYLVYKQALVNAVNGAEEIFLVRLDPARDDQDGSAADPAVVKLAETQITQGEGQLQWSVTSRIGSDKRIHVTYMDYDSVNCPGTPYTVTDAHVTFAGKIVARFALTSTGSATSCFPQARLAPARNRIVWPDAVAPGVSEILSSQFARVESGSRGFLSCSLGNPHGSAWRAGEMWLLLGLFVLLLLRRGSRRH